MAVDLRVAQVLVFMPRDTKSRGRKADDGANAFSPGRSYWGFFFALARVC